MPNPTYTPSELAPEVIKVGDKLHTALDEISEDNGIFSNISTALQQKTGQVDPYDKEDIADTISNDLVFPSGTINISSNGDYDVSAKETAHVAVPAPTFESKTATPTAIQFDVEPSAGFDGLSKVTVLAALFGIDTNSLSHFEFGIDADGLYYTDEVGGGTPVYMGVDARGLYVTGGNANA